MGIRKLVTNSQRWLIRQAFKHKEDRPKIFVAGAMKCGTTSMFQYLSMHPELSPPSIKEPCYFEYGYKKGILWYYRLFSRDVKGPVSIKHFDASPVYLHYPKSARRIFKYAPDSRLIFLFRDPIERAYSHHRYYSNKESMFAIKNPEKIETRSFDEAVIDDIEGRETRLYFRYCRISKYEEQLREYSRYFGPNQMLLIDSHDLKHNTITKLRETASFLSLNSQNFWDNLLVSDEIVDSAASLKLGKEQDLKLFNAQSYTFDIANDTRQLLVDFFKPDVERLVSTYAFKPEWAKHYLHK